MAESNDTKASWPVAEAKLFYYESEEAKKRPDVFVQWKGTDVCLDLNCDCGTHSHYDGYFAYTIQCPNCGSVWLMPVSIKPIKVDPTGHNPVMGNMS